MSKAAPDHHDAELVLRLYELRRESVMRESRATINGKFWPKSYEDVAALLRPDHSLNAAWRQVGTYWEMAYGMVKHGIVNPAYFLESNGEGLFLFAKVEPYLDTLRAEVSPVIFRNVEWVARECPEGRALYEVTSARVRKMAAAR